ncbi:MAG: glutathione peroxidase [Flavobacteriales bacterium]|nr:glutathione peroxidase [Flavobacteriales bacterium]
MLQKLIALPVLVLSFFGMGMLNTQSDTMTLHNFKVNDIDGKPFDLAALKGKKVMVVNVASECGYTPQYTQMQELYEQFGGDEFTIVAFPANNFGAQEPGTEAEIKSFCQKNYGVTFPVMSKISVIGEDQHELYKFLTTKELNGVSDHEVRWNFHKFLIDENGRVVRDVSTSTLPTDESIITWIES